MRASREAYPAKPLAAGTIDPVKERAAIDRAERAGVFSPEEAQRMRIDTVTRGNAPIYLAPCPFCGGGDIDPHYMTDGDIAPIHGDGAMPGCRSCGATAPNREAWNRRTYSTPMRQQRLEEQAMKADEAEARAGRAMAQNDRVLEQNDRLMAKCEKLQQQAQIHAQEARTANATINEIYQVCTGATGEPGNWNRAEPVRQLLQRAQRAEAECERLRSLLREARGWCPQESYSVGSTAGGGNFSMPTGIRARIDSALATPPTEGEPEQEAHPLRLDRVQACEFHGRDFGACAQHSGQIPCEPEGGDAPHNPQQEHGDALAVLDYLSGVLNNPQITTLSQNGWVELRARLENIRRHLTASGVPYINDELRQLAGWMRDDAFSPAQCAAVLDQVLASAPAVHPDYPRASMGELRGVYGIVLKYIDRLNDPISEAEFNLDAAQMCDELSAVIAAAPSGAGE